MFIVPITKLEPSFSLEELRKTEDNQPSSGKKAFGSFLMEAIEEADQALQETSEIPSLEVNTIFFGSKNNIYSSQTP